MRTIQIMICAVAIAATCAIPLDATAQAPETIAYQGKLTDASGRPITVATDVTFAVYDSPGGGTQLYSTTLSITPDINGIFTVELGPFGASVFGGDARYLGITVAGDTEMTPRQLLTSTPYSLKVNAAPGIASDYGSSSYITLTATDINLASVTIDVPAAGFVILVASAYYTPMHVSGTKDLGRFSISRSSATHDYNYLANVSTPANTPTDSDIPLPICLHRVDAVAPGSHSYYLVADRFTGSPRVSKGRLAAMFFPAAYGAIGASPISAMPGETPVQGDSNDPEAQ